MKYCLSLKEQKCSQPSMLKMGLLTDESTMLTTFNSPFGRFRWCRLPFGESPAPEEYQRRLNHASEDLKGVFPIHDDILIYGEGTTDEEAL